MPSNQTTADYILEQIAKAGNVRARKMFGEYTIYCDEKIVGFVADDQLFIKPTQIGKKFLEHYKEKPPYPGAKLCLLVPGDRWEDHEWLTELIRLSAVELPLPKKK